MASDNVIEVGIGVDGSQLQSGMQQAANAVKQATDAINAAFAKMQASASTNTNKVADDAKKMGAQVNSSTESMSGGFAQMLQSFQNAGGGFGAVASMMQNNMGLIKGGITSLAAIAAGSIFKHFIDETIAEGKELSKLSNALGITIEEANKLNIALRMSGIAVDDYTAMIFKLDIRLKSQPESFERLGIKIKDANGQLLNQQEIMQNALARMNEYKAGIDRNQFALDVFGRSAADAARYLKLNSERMEEARKFADELGIGMDKNGVQQSKEFIIQQAKLSIVLEEFGQKIGEAVLPAAIELGRIILYLAKEALPVFAEALNVVVSVIKYLGSIIGIVFKGIYNLVVEVGDIFKEIFKSNIPENVQESVSYIKLFNAGIVEVAAYLKSFFVAVVGGWEQLGLAIKQAIVWVNAFFGAIADKGVSGAFDAAAAASLKVGDEIIAKAKEINLQLSEIEKNKIKSMDEIFGGKKKTEDTTDVVKGGLSYKPAPTQGKEGSESIMSTWQAELEDMKLKYVILNQGREMDKVQEMMFWKSKSEIVSAGLKNTQAALKNAKQIEKEEVTKAFRVQDEFNKLEIESAKSKGLAEIAEASSTANFLKNLGAITNAEFLEKTREFENQKFAIEIQAMDKLRIEMEKDYIRNELEIRKSLETKERLIREHNLRLKELDQKRFEETNKTYLDMFNSAKSGFRNTLSEFLKGGMSISSFMKNIMINILDSITNAIANMLTKMIANWAMAALFGTQTSGEMSRLAIGASAAQAGAAAAASVAAIPFTGWAMAEPVGAAVYASTLAYEAFVPVAAKGYDIPAGVNPLTQLHEKEMVLPAEHAETIRKMAGEGGSATNITINAIDADSVKKLFKKHGVALVDSLKSQSRNFKVS